MKIRINNKYNLSKSKRWINLILCILFVLCMKLTHAQTITNNGDTIYISNGALIYINGGLTNLDNGSNHAYIRNEGTMQITGDLVKSPSMVYVGNDTLLLAGSGAQNIAGLPYWYVAVTSGGTKTLTGNASVTKSVVLTNGNINTSSFTLTLDSQAIITEDASNFVTGKVAVSKYLAKGTNYTFGGIGLELKADSLNPGLTTVTRTTGSHLSGNGNQGINRYFDVVPTNNGHTGSTLVFHYFDGELNSITESDLGLYRKKNTKWEYDAFSNRNSSLNTLTASIDSFGKFTLGGISNPLPVELISFFAKLKDAQTSILNWETASEINNDHFDIERSEDGHTFYKIAEEKGQGTVNTLTAYEYEDHFGIVNTNVLYYRLRQIDFNGKYAYSEIRKLNLTEKPDNLKAWYNANNDKLEAIVSSEKPTLKSLRLIDIQGKLITEQNLAIEKGETHIQLEMVGLAKGVYTLTVMDNDGVEVKRVMKY